MKEHLENHFYLEFTVKLFQCMSLWPDEKRSFKMIKDNYILMIIVVSTFPLKADFVLQFYNGDYSITSLIEAVIAISALYSVIYISVCFMLKKNEIKMLVENLKIFEKYLPKPAIQETERLAKFYTKIFVLYSVVGNVCYAILPVIQYNNCELNKSNHMKKYGIPCGLIARYVLPFKFDMSPVSEFMMLEQAFVCTLGTFMVMTVTMLVCGILTHVSANLSHLKKMILNISEVTEASEIERQVKKCVKYHTIIIRYSDKINDAFNTIMLVHITWTSFIISVLGFEIIIETNYSNTSRFVMHLAGWIGMLFLICFYGQTLMNKSWDISTAVYNLKWYEKPTDVRKALVLMLLRAQRPLTLKAAGVNVMSLPTFLGVLSTAYSYFTLLLKLKP